MHPYQETALEQRRLLAELHELDPLAENFEREFERVAAALIEQTEEMDRMLQERPGLRREIGFVP